jgi:protein phosphatase 2C-like protein
VSTGRSRSPGPWPYLAGATVQGRDHRACGRENQDAFRAVATADGQAQIMAVADGAGSQPRSALGAQIAVDAACGVLAATWPAPADTDGWLSWLHAARTAVTGRYLRTARAAGGAGDGAGPPAVGELAATLAAVVICPPWAGFLAVGDCFGAALTSDAAVLASDSGERCHLVLPPDSRTEFTTFLSSDGAADRMRSFVLWDPDLSGVMLATDGCAALALDHPARHGLEVTAGPQPAAGFFVGLARAVRAAGGGAEPIHDLLSGAEADRCADDLTVVCALREAGPCR